MCYYYPDAAKLGGARGKGLLLLHRHAFVAGLSITDMDLTNRSRSVPRYGSISLRSVYESVASFLSGLGSPTNYCPATRTGTASGSAAVVGAVSTNDDSTAAAGPVTASAFGPGTIRRGGV